jgi:hypothetical protein
VSGKEVKRADDVGILPRPEPGLDGSALRKWLSKLPDAEFEKLIGTPEMGKHVVRVATQIHEDHGHGSWDSVREVDLFLTELNGRIRSCSE